MSIVSLFCEVDDFFLAYEKYITERQLSKNAGFPPYRKLLVRAMPNMARRFG